METCSQSSSQQILWKDVEMVKEKKAKYQTHQRVALALVLVFLVMALSVFSLRYLWSPSLGKVYDHQYKALLDGIETESMLEIDPGQRVEIFRIGNGNEEVIEVHDFKNGITGIRFAEHQRCYIRTQTRKLPTVAEVEAEDTDLLVDEAKAMDIKVEESHVWVLEEEPIVNPAFLLNSKIWEICQNLPIHWIHPSPLSDDEVENVDTPDAEATGQRFARDVLDHPAVSDYRDVGIELDNRLDDNGYCCQHCRRGYRYCRRYFEPLGGFNQWPYYYQGGRVICQVVMPCNWWIARMLGRV
ncbi:putative tenomodulin [Scophthalmus maximus]|uniref:Tenomodulin n=1 Tax=Scophthalmus maximus TaxID=52904 RepID=A0A2U9C882_SCOMX|nr:tenomodulin isoform X2 [Scophthalmus maximus]AWP11829.1 putative tenomodulin [Scophthalmus maximus]